MMKGIFFGALLTLALNAFAEGNVRISGEDALTIEGCLDVSRPLSKDICSNLGIALFNNKTSGDYSISTENAGYMGFCLYHDYSCYMPDDVRTAINHYLHQQAVQGAKEFKGDK